MTYLDECYLSGLSALAAIDLTDLERYARLALVLTLFIAIWQVWTHTTALKLNTLATRHNLFLSLTDCMTDVTIRTMKMHLVDHCNLDIYRDRYEGNDERLQSYFLMKRKYLYLLFAARLERSFPIDDKGIAEKWINELADYQEFHDVHASQKHYDPQFEKLVDGILANRSVRGWMFEADKPSPPSPPDKCGNRHAIGQVTT
jgi:hypothetical protein